MTNNSDTKNPTALDQLLDMAPPPPPSPHLAQQILATVTQPSNVVDFVSRSIKPTARQNNISNWLIGGLMAASFTIGIWSGTNDFADLLVTAPLELAGIIQPQDIDFYNLLDGFTATEGFL